MAVPPALRVAVVVLALEALALAAAAAILVLKTITGHPDEAARALLGAGMALLGALVLAACARGLLALRPSARTPALVLQVLALPVGYSLGFQAGLIGYGGPILFAAVAVIFLLFSAPVRAVLDRPE